MILLFFFRGTFKTSEHVGSGDENHDYTANRRREEQDFAMIRSRHALIFISVFHQDRAHSL